MNPEEAKKFIKRLLDIDKFPKLMFNVDIPHYLLPVASPPAENNTIDTIIVIAPPGEIFLHFADTCRKAGWTSPDGIVRQNIVRAEYHVKNNVDDYIICVARRG